MKVTFLGTGDAFHGGGRAHSSLLVEDSLGAFLVDCGPTAPHALARTAVGQRGLDAVVLTHLHGDHYAGVPFLLLDALHGAGRERPFVVAGPPSTAARVEALFRLTYQNAADRRRPFLMDYRELEPGQAIDLAGRRVVALRARHMSGGETALCLRIETDGQVIAVSGDTAETEELSRLADGADLFVCECALAESNPDVLHLSVADIERLRPAWRTPRVVLTHLSAEARERAKGLRDVAVADDGYVLAM